MRTIADKNPAFSPGTLPGQLGLTEEQARAAQEAIEEARQGPATMDELIGALKAVLHGLDDADIGPAEAVTQELDNWEDLLHVSIAYRALAKGLQLGKQLAQEQPADPQRTEVNG